jgi:predicted RNase H-like nuclease (RuvC/YqgF family)
MVASREMQSTKVVNLSRNAQYAPAPTSVKALSGDATTGVEYKILLDLTQKIEQLETIVSQLEPLVEPLEANNWKMHGLSNALKECDRRIRSLETRNAEILKLERNLFRRH